MFLQLQRNSFPQALRSASLLLHSLHSSPLALDLEQAAVRSAEDDDDDVAGTHSSHAHQLRRVFFLNNRPLNQVRNQECVGTVDRNDIRGSGSLRYLVIVPIATATITVNLATECCS